MTVVDFGQLSHADLTPTLLVTSSGDVVGANPAAQELICNPLPATLREIAVSPNEVLAYLRDCSGTSEASPGVVRLHTRAGVRKLACRGAALRAAAGSTSLIVLRFPQTTAHQAFAALTEHIERLSAEIHARREAERKLSLALTAARMGTWTWERATDRLLLSDRAADLFGLPAGLELRWSDIMRRIGPEHAQRVRSAVLERRNSGGHFVVQYPVYRPDGAQIWIDVFGHAQTGRSGRVEATAGVVMDVTDRKQSEDRLRLLAREVDHRARNMLATMQAVVRMTRAENLENYSETITGRLFSLANAHTLIANSGWVGVSLRRILEDELALYGTGDPMRVQLEGRDVILDPASTQGLALTLHELATNAAKYGAFSRPEGRVRVDWTLEDGKVALRWIEEGGPPVSKPTRQGFGTRLMEGSVRQMRGTITFDWCLRGLRCELTAAIRHQRMLDIQRAG